MSPVDDYLYFLFNRLGELGGQPPELALSTAPNNRANLEYLYTLIRFSTTADWVCAELLEMPNLVT